MNVQHVLKMNRKQNYTRQLIERLFVLQVIKKYYNTKKENNTDHMSVINVMKFSRKYNFDRHELTCFIDVIEDNSLPLNSVNLKKY